MRKVLFLIMLMFQIGVYAQNIQNLENNPTFKGIKIGMSIHDNSLSGKLSYEKSINGYVIYKITDSYYYSVFNIKMNYVRIITKNHKVHAIEVIKMIKATDVGGTVVFDATELEIIETQLAKLFGRPTCKLSENNSERLRTGMQWESTSKLANCFIDFYGTMVGYKLQFSMCEYSIDF